MSIEWTPTAHKVIEARPYKGRIERLSVLDEKFFIEQYELRFNWRIAAIAVDPDTQRYVLPIFGPFGSVRGHVLRRPWVGAPRIDNRADGLPKADTYKIHPNDPLQSWYLLIDWPPTDSPSCAARTLVLVEDQLSAIKLASNGIACSVALLGVPVSGRYGTAGQDRVREIAKVANARDQEVIIALDADATDKAFEFQRRWGAAFKRSRVAILGKDIKDTPIRSIPYVLGLPNA